MRRVSLPLVRSGLVCWSVHVFIRWDLDALLNIIFNIYLNVCGDYWTKIIIFLDNMNHIYDVVWTVYRGRTYLLGHVSEVWICLDLSIYLLHIYRAIYITNLMIVEGHTNICSSHFIKEYIYGILFCKIIIENIIYDWGFNYICSATTNGSRSIK